MTDWQPLSIIGTGVLGTSLGILLKRAGAPVLRVVGRTPQKAKHAAEHIGCEWALGAASALHDTPWLLIAVPDDAIAPLAVELADAWRGRVPPLAAAIHTSGALGTAALRPLGDIGVALGTSHPLQSLARVQTAVEWLPQSAFAVSGSGAGLDLAAAVPTLIGARVLRLDDEARPLYHAAACVASNYLSVLMGVATDWMRLATGASEAEVVAALLPLVHGTLGNIDRYGPDSALTGPIARGDAGTVATHLQALDRLRHGGAHEGGEVPALWDGIYRTLGEMALHMARRRGLDEEKAAAVERQLQKDVTQ